MPHGSNSIPGGKDYLLWIEDEYSDLELFPITSFNEKQWDELYPKCTSDEIKEREAFFDYAMWGGETTCCPNTGNLIPSKNLIIKNESQP